MNNTYIGIPPLKAQYDLIFKKFVGGIVPWAPLGYAYANNARNSDLSSCSCEDSFVAEDVMKSTIFAKNRASAGCHLKALILNRTKCTFSDLLRIWNKVAFYHRIQVAGNFWKRNKHQLRSCSKQISFVKPSSNLFWDPWIYTFILEKVILLAAGICETVISFDTIMLRKWKRVK